MEELGRPADAPWPTTVTTANPAHKPARSSPLNHIGGSRLSIQWNSQIDRAVTHQAWQEPVPTAQGPALARTLLNCEREMQQGLGVGHSLSATVIIDPS